VHPHCGSNPGNHRLTAYHHQKLLSLFGEGGWDPERSVHAFEVFRTAARVRERILRTQTKQTVLPSMKLCDVFSIGPDGNDRQVPVTAFAAFFGAFLDQSAFNFNHNAELDLDRSYGLFRCISLLSIRSGLSTQQGDRCEWESSRTDWICRRKVGKSCAASSN
jgi:hypothetical protein